NTITARPMSQMTAVYAMLPNAMCPRKGAATLNVPIANSTVATILAQRAPARLARATTSQAAISNKPYKIAPVMSPFWYRCSVASVACGWLARRPLRSVAAAITLITMPIAVTAAPAYIRRTAITIDRGGAVAAGSAGGAGTADLGLAADPGFAADPDCP